MNQEDWEAFAKEQLELNKRRELIDKDREDVVFWAINTLSYTGIVSAVGKRTGLLFYMDTYDLEQTCLAVVDNEDQVVEAFTLRALARQIEGEYHDMLDDAENIGASSQFNLYKRI